MSNLSTLEELKKRTPIVEIDKSKIRADTYIVTFTLGDQANINGETYNQLNNLNIESNGRN